MTQLRCHLVFHVPWPTGGGTSPRMGAVVDGLVTLVGLFESFEDALASVHIDGRVLEHLEANHRALADRLAALVSSGRLEAVGGGFYSPLLAMLMWRDAVGQLEMSAGFWDRRTGIRPQGAWLFEQVWMPRMSEILSDAGVKWTLLDESRFQRAGLGESLDGWYVTEHVARPIGLLPIDAATQTDFALRSPHDAIDRLRGRLDRANNDVTLTWAGSLALDDPQQRQWWSEFLRLSGDEQSWFTLAQPRQTLSLIAPKGRVYLSGAMSGAAAAHCRRLDESDSLIGEPTWQRYFAFYGEADRLHKRMIEVSRRFAAVERVMRNGGWRTMSQLTRPRRMLYRAQAGLAYGHGQGAGIHSAEVRAQTYRDLIQAELACDALVPSANQAQRLEVGLRDVFADLSTAVVLRSPSLRVVIHPKRSGGVWGLEHLATARAFHDVLTRRKEPYHDVGVQGVDDHERAAFVDRVIARDARPATWMLSADDRADFMGQDYRLLSVDDHGDRTVVTLSADGHISGPDGALRCGLVKEYTLWANEPCLSCSWTFECESSFPQELDFAVELNLSTLGDPTAPQVFADDPSAGAQPFSLVWPDAAVGLHIDGQSGSWSLESERIETVAQPSGHAAQSKVQGVCIMARHPLPIGQRVFQASLRLQWLDGQV